jgi:hypothetical protein
MRLAAPPSSARWLSGARELCIQLLGRFSVQVETRLVPELAHRRRPAALLQLLALAPGHRLHREQVLDLLWPELEPDAAANNNSPPTQSTADTLWSRSPQTEVGTSHDLVTARLARGAHVRCKLQAL